MTATQEADRALVADAFERWDDLTPEAKKAALQIADRLTGASLLPKPQPGPQTAFLESEADIVVYGGAAGGGKTFGLFLESVKDRDNPGFRFVYFRREQTQITKAGGPWDKSMGFYPLYGAYPNKTSYKWKFPSGAEGQFASLQYDVDVLGWQTAEIPLIIFDELTHFTEDQFWYMLSRNRSTSGARRRVCAGTNPDGGSWVKGLIAPWVDKEWPAADRAMPSEVRYVARVEDKIAFVPKDYRDPKRPEIKPKSLTFIPSKVEDNPALLEADPDYKSNLLIQNPVNAARLLEGDWGILDGAYFSQWSEALHVRLPGEDVRSPMEVPAWYKFFAGLDYGRAAPFCCLLMAADDAGNIIVFDEIYKPGLEPSQQAEMVAAMIEKYHLRLADVPIYCDPSIFPGQEAVEHVGQAMNKTVVTIARPSPGWSMNANDGKHISDEYEAKGLRVIRAARANTRDERINGWAMVREYLLRPGALTVYKGRCINLIRTIGVLPHDKADAEDLDTHSEDHAADALRFALRNRGMKAKERPGPDTVPEYRPSIFNQSPALKQALRGNKGLISI